MFEAKAKNLNDLYRQWKVGTIIETEFIFNLLLEVSTSTTIEMPNIWDKDSRRLQK